MTEKQKTEQAIRFWTAYFKYHGQTPRHAMIDAVKVALVLSDYRALWSL